VKRRADIEAHRDPMELCHHRVFEAGAQKLIAGAKDFGPDESRDVIHDHPCAGLLAKISSHAVSARFEGQHINTLSGLIGDRRTLTRFEIEAIESACQIEKPIDIKPDDSAESPRSAGETLKTDIDAS